MYLWHDNSPFTPVWKVWHDLEIESAVLHPDHLALKFKPPKRLGKRPDCHLFYKVGDSEVWCGLEYHKASDDFAAALVGLRFSSLRETAAEYNPCDFRCEAPGRSGFKIHGYMLEVEGREWFARTADVTIQPCHFYSEMPRLHMKAVSPDRVGNFD